jgi:hypothetical protein
MPTRLSAKNKYLRHLPGSYTNSALGLVTALVYVKWF